MITPTLADTAHRAAKNNRTIESVNSVVHATKAKLKKGPPDCRQSRKGRGVSMPEPERKIEFVV